MAKVSSQILYMNWTEEVVLSGLGNKLLGPLLNICTAASTKYLDSQFCLRPIHQFDDTCYVYVHTDSVFFIRVSYFFSMSLYSKLRAANLVIIDPDN